MDLKYMMARFNGKCAACSGVIARHEYIYHHKDSHRAWHEKCKPGSDESPAVPPAPTEEPKSEVVPAPDAQPDTDAPQPVGGSIGAGSMLEALIKDIASKVARGAVDADTVRSIVKDELTRATVPQLITLEVKVNDAPPVTVEHPHKDLPEMVKVLSCKENLWITGPSGSGKTQAAEHAAQVLGIPYQLLSCSQDTTASDILGTLLPNGDVVRTPASRAYLEGGLLLVDEATASGDALIVLNALTSNGMCAFPDGMHPRHPTFFCVAADNTWGVGPTAEYNSRRKVDAAFLARFSRMFWDYDSQMEQAVCGNPTLAAKYQALRAYCNEKKVKVVISIRQMRAASRFVAAGFTETRALQLTVTAGLAADTAASLHAFYDKM